jgi:hypothetical protein
MPKTNFTHRVGTVSGSDPALTLLDVVRATLRTTFRPRFELHVSRFFFLDLPLVAKSSADYADLSRRKQDRTGDCSGVADVSRACASPVNFGNQNGCPTVKRDAALRAAHIRARTGVDLDRFAFLDEKRNVDGFAGFELCRFGYITGGIAAKAFW